jgi:hypothetical protein
MNCFNIGSRYGFDLFDVGSTIAHDYLRDVSATIDRFERDLHREHEK